MEYGKIEKGIPFRATSAFTEILRQCEVGDSFLWTKPNVHTHARQAGFRIGVRSEGTAYRIFLLEKL